ncbi:MAG: DNA repair protein RadA [Candidatus Aminicenantes bacterium]|nr:DNA repair protein RadA [Candidatus Aminicenantes bacterium]
MKKTKSVYTCQACGFQTPKWVGRCPSCGEWETMIEEISETVETDVRLSTAAPVLYENIEESEKKRIQTDINELNRVLGGGVVLGSLVLIGGEPGIGKSTLLLQLSGEFAAKDRKVLYVSGEESLEQIKIRGERIGLKKGDLFLLAETNLERIILQAEKLKPEIFILDSVQTVFSSTLTSSPGTISQVREVAHKVFHFAKTKKVPSFLVGHITKEGSLAGPKALEHMVDVVLYFEGDRDHNHRVLRAFKNRFGSVSELGVFEMRGTGLHAVENPSAFFLKERSREAVGSAVVCTIKGSRPLLAEIQALVSSTLFVGSPRRMTIGLDHYRASMLLAILEKNLGYGFSGEDIYLNVAGGLSLDETASDLGVVVAVISCMKNKPVPPEICVFGEVGLSGEIRSVSQPMARIKEAQSQGFTKIFLPENNLSRIEKREVKGVTLGGVHNVKDTLMNIF